MGQENLSHTGTYHPALLSQGCLSNGMLATEWWKHKRRREDLDGEKFWHCCRGKASAGWRCRKERKKQKQQKCPLALACLRLLQMEADVESIKEYSLKMFCKHFVMISNRKMAPSAKDWPTTWETGHKYVKDDSQFREANGKGCQKFLGGNRMGIRDTHPGKLKTLKCLQQTGGRPGQGLWNVGVWPGS